MTRKRKRETHIMMPKSSGQTTFLGESAIRKKEKDVFEKCLILCDANRVMYL